MESIAGISGKQASATEELLATLEEHNTNIESMYNLMRGIKDSSDNLQVLLNNNLYERITMTVYAMMDYQLDSSISGEQLEQDMIQKYIK